MNTLKGIVLTLLIPVLFFGSVGMDVFKHICEDDGVSVSFVINTIDHCEEHQEELPPCCEEEKEDDCCDDEVEYFQAKLDFFQSVDQTNLFVEYYAVPKPFFVIADVIVEPGVQFFSNTDPPPKRLPSRLAILQTYLI